MTSSESLNLSIAVTLPSPAQPIVVPSISEVPVNQGRETIEVNVNEWNRTFHLVCVTILERRFIDVS